MCVRRVRKEREGKGSDLKNMLNRFNAILIFTSILLRKSYLFLLLSISILIINYIDY